MHRHTHIRCILVGIAAALTASCNTGLAGPNGSVTAISISAAVDTAVALGDTVPFHAIATDRSGATLSGVTYTWTSSAPDVATVSKDGVVIAVGNGVTTIQAAVNGVTGSAPFAVRQVAVALMVALTHDTIATIGHTVQATAQPTDARGNPLGAVNAVWTTSNPAVATVDDGGLVRGVATGQAVIRAETGAFGNEDTVTVRQFPAAVLILGASPTYGWTIQAGRPFAVNVELDDSAGNALAPDTTTAISVFVNGGWGRLVGRTTVPLTDGVVSFDSLVWEGRTGLDSLKFVVGHGLASASTLLEIEAGPAAAMFAISGENQSGTAGSPLELPLEVKVVDAYGNGAFGTVSWSLGAGSGTLETGVSWTDSYGIAQTTYTLGQTVGTDTVLAAFDSIPGSPVVFQESTKPATTSSAAARRY